MEILTILRVIWIWWEFLRSVWCFVRVWWGLLMVYLVYWDLFGGCQCWDLWVFVYLQTTIFFSQKYGGFLRIPIQLKIGVTPPRVALATDLPRQGPSQLSSAATSLVGAHAG